MADCGFTRERLDAQGNLCVSACYIWGDCPHQPVTVYDVWGVQAVTAAGPDVWHFIGRFGTRLEARLAELGTSADWITFVYPVQYCLWPVRHPQPLEED